MGHDVADGGQAGLRADDVGARRGHQAAADAHAVVDALGDGLGRQPRGEAQVVEPVQVADLRRQEPRRRAGHRPEGAPVDPHAHHLRAGLEAVDLAGRREVRLQAGQVRGPRPDDVAQQGQDAGRLAHHEERLRRQPVVLEGHGHRAVTLEGHAPAGLVELPLVEVADGVGGVQAVALQEGAQQHPVGRRAGHHAARLAGPAAGHRGHQAARLAGPAPAARAAGRPEGRPEQARLGHQPGDQLRRRHVLQRAARLDGRRAGPPEPRGRRRCRRTAPTPRRGRRHRRRPGRRPRAAVTTKNGHVVPLRPARPGRTCR